jgi:hypothetical protein
MPKKQGCYKVILDCAFCTRRCFHKHGIQMAVYF